MARSILIPAVISSIVSTVLSSRVGVVHEVHVRHVNQPRFHLMPRYTNTSTTVYPGSTSSIGEDACLTPTTSYTTFTPPISLSTSLVSDITTNTHTTIDGTLIPILSGCSTFCPTGPTGVLLGGVPDTPGVYPPPTEAPSGFPTVTIGSDLNPTICPANTDTTAIPPDDGPTVIPPGGESTTDPANAGLTTLPPPASVATSIISDVTANTHTTIDGTPVPVLHGCSFCPAGPAGIILRGIPDVPGIYPPPSDAPPGFPTITIGNDLNPTVATTDGPDSSDLTTQPPPTSISTSIISDVTTNTHTTIDGVPVPVLHGCAFCPLGPLGIILGGIPDVPGIYPPPLTPPFPGFPTVTIGDDLNPTIDTNNDITTDPSATTTTTEGKSSSTPSTSTTIPTETIVPLDWTTWESTDESDADDDDAASYAESLINSLWSSVGTMDPAPTDNPPAAGPQPSVSVQIWRINEELHTEDNDASLKTSQTVAIEVGVNDFPNPCGDNDLVIGSPVFLWYQYESYQSPSVNIPSKFDLKNLTASGCTFSGTFGQSSTLTCDNNFSVECYTYAGQTGYACGPGAGLIGCSATQGDCLPSYWKVADCNF